MEVNDALISKLEILSKLKMDPSEIEQLKKELGNMVDMFDVIGQVNTDHVEPSIHLTDAANVMRNDIAENQLTVTEALSNAPKKIGRYFAVPKVID